MVQNKGAKQLKSILDKYMNKVVQARFLLFPLVVQSHWTLVVLDKDDGNWKFYNSMLHRVGKDIYCGATDNLVSKSSNFCQKLLVKFQILHFRMFHFFRNYNCFTLVILSVFIQHVDYVLVLQQFSRQLAPEEYYFYNVITSIVYLY